MGDFLGSYYYTLDAPSSKLALLRVEQPVSVLAMDAIQPSQTSDPRTHHATTKARWSALEHLHTRDTPSDALVPHPDLDYMHSVEDMLIERAESNRGEAHAEGRELDIPVASMSLFEPGTGLITLPLSRAYVSGKRVDVGEPLQRVPCAPGDSPMPKLHAVREIDMADAVVPGQVPDSGKVRTAAIKSASLRSSLMRFIGRKGLK